LESWGSLEGKGIDRLGFKSIQWADFIITNALMELDYPITTDALYVVDHFCERTGKGSG